MLNEGKKKDIGSKNIEKEVNGRGKGGGNER